MNATAIAPNSANSRLKRIKTVSSIIRAVFILLLIFYSAITLISWFGAVQQINQDNIPLNRGMIVDWLLGTVIGITKVAQFWMAYKLFTCFTVGGWFTGNSTKWLRRIGFVSLAIWFLGLYFHVPFAWGQLGFDHIQYLPAMQQLRQYVGFAMACVQLNTDLLAAFLFIFMAWIMDEGRKIQEEQELTV